VQDFGKLPLERRRRLEDNIKSGFGQISCNGGKWMELVQDRVQWSGLLLTLLNLWVLLGLLENWLFS